jgi:hypothetical protein
LKRSGELFPISNMGVNRKGFLLRSALVMGGIFLNGCVRKLGGKNEKYKHIKGSLKGPDEKAGHLLRDKMPIATPAYVRKVKTLIVGAGISGLSAGRWLKKEGREDFEILELENHAGGNSHSETNKISSYPLGAHYITIANNDDQLLTDFLQENEVITHFENGLPFYNEFYLCFDPEERLLINGQWQDGLIPKFGISKEDQQQIERFFNLSAELKHVKGKDGRYAFNIPVDSASADEAFRRLDKVSFKDYLIKEGFSSAYLLWYLNYCCKDDFGQQIDNVSAWAGLNYFAGHKGTAANAESGAVLTWPEGNGFLVKKLKSYLKQHIRTSTLVSAVVKNKDSVEVSVVDLLKNETYTITADQVIMACPQFVNKHILKNIDRDLFDYDQLNYAPWVVANITLKDFPTSGLQTLSWDNVPYNMPSVGYVYAGQQNLNRDQLSKVITFYLPLCDREPRVARLAAYSRNYDQWLDIIIPELEYMHPEVTPLIECVDIWVWGHGMITPSVNYIWGEQRAKAQSSVDDRIFFAHTDISGISLFEEGFHQGINAAKSLLEAQK